MVNIHWHFLHFLSTVKYFSISMYEYQYSASKIYKLFIISSLLYFYNVLLYQLFNRRHVGMADEADSKSVVGNYVWVQVPLPAFLILHKLYKSRQVLDFAGFFVAQNFKKCQGLSKICPAFTSRVHTFDHLSQTVPKKFFLYSKRGSASNSAVPLFIYTVCKPNASNCFYFTHK